MKMKYSVLFSIAFCLIAGTLVKAQTTRPYINSVSPASANIGETVTIVGSGFPTNSANLLVYVGGVSAAVTSNSSTLIEITVPFGSSYSEIEVIDTSTGVSGTSNAFFMSSYGGDGMAQISSTVFQAAFESVRELDIDITAGQTQNFPFDLCLCDFDQDGKQDVVVTAQDDPASGGAKRVVFRNTSTSSTLTLTPVLELKNQPSRNVTCGDIDGDGKPDLLVSEITNDGGTTDIEIFRNTSSTGTISFSSSNDPELELVLPRDQNNDLRTPARIALVDLDLDGKKDIVSTTINDNAVDIWKNTSSIGSISFAASNTSVVSLPEQDDVARAIKITDLNNDGLKDIILAVADGSSIYIYENQSIEGNFQFKEGQLITVSGQLLIQNIESADINDDGFNDIIVTDGNASANATNEIIIFPNTTGTVAGAVSFGTDTRLDANSAPWGISIGDLDGDGKVDIASGAANDNSINVYINRSTADNLNFTAYTLSAGRNSRNIKIADVNGDRKPDILAVTDSRSQTPGKLSVFVNRNCITPEISPSDDIYCPGTPFVVTATPVPDATFNFEVSTDNGATWNSRQSGTSNTYDLGSDVNNTGDVRVRVTATDSQCERTSAAASIQKNTITPSYSSFSISASANVCEGSTLALSSTATTDNYYWTGPNEFTSTSPTPSIDAISAAGGGTYSLSIQTDGGCKSDPQTTQVNVIALPQPNIVNLGEDNFCAGGQTTLKTTSFPGFTSEWNINGEGTGDTDNSLTVENTSVVTLTLTSEALAGCNATGESLVINEVNPPTPVIQSDAEICVDVPLTFNSTVTGASEYNFTYAWNVADADGTSVGTADTDTIEATFSSAGVYTANLTVGYELVNNCTTTVNASVTASTPPTIAITASDTVICPADTVTLEMPTDLVSYDWSTGASTSSINVSTPEDSDTLNVSVTVVNSIGCTVTSTIQIRNFDDGGITITSPDAEIPITNQLLNIPAGSFAVELQANGGTDYQWTPELIFDDPQASLVTVRPRAVTTDIILTGTDINNCFESDSLRMINDNVQARKSFSPNGDGLGFECWEILNSSNLSGCTLYVLDTRGRTIWQADTPFEDDCAWNGIDQDGKASPEGVYFFVLKCDDTELNRTGNLLLGR